MNLLSKILITSGYVTLLVISTPIKAVEGAAGHHQHAEHVSTSLVLNEGQKWQTDTALRQAMKKINLAVMDAADAFHNDKLTSKDANKVAKQINDQVSYMVQNCKLAPKADATLHVLIGDFLNAAEKMKAKPLSNEGMPNAVKALMAYPEYFDHPDWEGFSH